MGTRILANGVFDILHPGHLHYLTESAALGDDLRVVVTPDSMTEKDTVFPGEDRERVVDALACVDEAFLGATGDTHVYDTVEQVNPDIVTLGYDQGFDPDALQQDLQRHGFTVDVVRIGKYPKREISSTLIKERLRDNS